MMASSIASGVEKYSFILGWAGFIDKSSNTPLQAVSAMAETRLKAMPFIKIFMVLIFRS